MRKPIDTLKWQMRTLIFVSACFGANFYLFIEDLSKGHLWAGAFVASMNGVNIWTGHTCIKSILTEIYRRMNWAAWAAVEQERAERANEACKVS